MAPPLDVPPWAMLVLNMAGWGGWSVLVGYVAHRRPVHRFMTDSWLTRARGFERGGRFYERRLRIQRWKDLLPEAGALFEGGISKRSIGSRRPGRLERFVAETRRAEWTHWSIMAAAPVFFLWNWWWADILIVIYAIAANLPCVLVQRYNRARVRRILENRRAVGPSGIDGP